MNVNRNNKDRELSKEGRTNNISDIYSGGASAETGNCALAGAIIGRYTDTASHGRAGLFARRELVGEKSLSLARDLTRRWKSPFGAKAFSCHPFPFSRNISRMGAEGSIEAHGVFDAGPSAKPAVRALIRQSGASPANALPARERNTLSSGTSGFDPAVAGMVGNVSGEPHDGPEAIAARPQPSIARKAAPTAGSSPPFSYGSAPLKAGKNISKGTVNGPEHAHDQEAIVERPTVTAEMIEVGRQIMERHNFPSLLRLYRQASDSFHFLQGNPRFSDSLPALSMNSMKEKPPEQGEMVINQGLVDSSSDLDGRTPLKKTAFRKGVATTSHISDITANLNKENERCADTNSNRDTKKSYATGESRIILPLEDNPGSDANAAKFPASEVSGQVPFLPATKNAKPELSRKHHGQENQNTATAEPRKVHSEARTPSSQPGSGRGFPAANPAGTREMITAPLCFRRHMPLGNFRPSLMRTEEYTAETRSLPNMALRFSVSEDRLSPLRQPGEPRSCSFAGTGETTPLIPTSKENGSAGAPEAGETPSITAERGFLPAPHLLMTKAAPMSLPRADLLNVRAVPEFTLFASYGLFGARLFRAQSSIDSDSHKTGGSPVVSGLARGNRIYHETILRPMAAESNSIMTGAHLSTVAFERGGPPLIKPALLKEFPVLPEKRQGAEFQQGNPPESTSGPAGYPGFPFPSLRLQRTTGFIDSSPRSGIPARAGGVMPLVTKKESVGSPTRGTGNRVPGARIGGQQNLYGFIQRSARSSAGNGSSTMPADVAASASDAAQPGTAEAGRSSAPYAPERIADEVYRIIERRLIAEKERKGL